MKYLTIILSVQILFLSSCYADTNSMINDCNTGLAPGYACSSFEFNLTNNTSNSLTLNAYAFTDSASWDGKVGSISSAFGNQQYSENSPFNYSLNPGSNAVYYYDDIVQNPDRYPSFGYIDIYRNNDIKVCSIKISSSNHNASANVFANSYQQTFSVGIFNNPDSSYYCLFGDDLTGTLPTQDVREEIIAINNASGYGKFDVKPGTDYATYTDSDNDNIKMSTVPWSYISIVHKEQV